MNIDHSGKDLSFDHSGKDLSFDHSGKDLSFDHSGKDLSFDSYVYPSELYLAEHEAAYYLARLCNTQCDTIPSITDGLLHEQPSAVHAACSQSLGCLTGPPGTGKTTTTKSIVKSFLAQSMKVLIVSPTGKASKRADEVVNELGTENSNSRYRIPCMTTNMALEFTPRGYKRNRRNPFDYDVIIMDEWSMQGIVTFRDFLEAVNPKRTRVIFSGDPYQLPSVDSGCVARDMLNAPSIPRTMLTVVLRTGKDSGITHNANRILRGNETTNRLPDDSGEFTDFFFVPCQNETEARNKITKWTVEDIPNRRNIKCHDIQTLTPGKNGLVGRKELNKSLRDAINPGGSRSVSGYRIGDKVRHLKNIRQDNVVNGDVGLVVDVVRAEGSGGHLVINFGPKTGPNLDGVTNIKVSDCDDRIQLSFCSTIHSSMGSEYQAVLIPIFSSHHILLTRNLVYTGMTRAKNLMCFIGDPKTMRHAIGNISTMRRSTRMTSLIQKFSDQLDLR